MDLDERGELKGRILLLEELWTFKSTGETKLNPDIIAPQLFQCRMLTAGDFIPAGVVCVLRAVFLTYAWILLVRRHLKERH